jgi:hypothetical protein
MRELAPDGSLLRWQDIEGEERWSALLLGNGLSINIWSPFHYQSLYAKARRLSTGGLDADDRALFQAIGTQNFERVLGDLSSSIRVLDALGKDTADLLQRYQSIQAALGEAIRAVHIPWADVSASTLAIVQQELHKFEWIFTTSYDLLLYWAMGHGDDYGRLVDLFWARNCRFNPKDTDIRVRAIPVYFLHGAMHLIVEGTGQTRKLQRTDALTLLDQFGQPMANDPQARPLLVTEGSWRHKLQAIESNAYLSHGLDTLQAPYLDVPVVVFGSALGEQDRHLTGALSVHPDRPIAVSMMPGPRAELRAKQADIYGRLEAKPLYFFDATTHPLGSADLSES